jgi:hypothetical protein
MPAPVNEIFNKVERRGYSGNISFTGAGISNRVISKVRYGNISFTGAGASNVVERIGGDQGDPMPPVK